MTDTSSDITTANRDFFNDLASKYDAAPWQKYMIQQITDFVQQNVEFIRIPHHDDSPTTLLDYACGTGLMSRALGPSVNAIQALDLSPKMVEVYNAHAASSPISSVHAAHAIEANLLTDQEPAAEVSGPELFNFDVAAVGCGFHHFPDPGKAVGRLAQRLRSGGVLVIVDFVAEEHPDRFSHAEHTIHKHGFSEPEMKGLMEDHGLTDFKWKEMPGQLELKFSEEKTSYKRGFLARASKL